MVSSGVVSGMRQWITGRASPSKRPQAAGTDVSIVVAPERDCRASPLRRVLDCVDPPVLVGDGSQRQKDRWLRGTLRFILATSIEARSFPLRGRRRSEGVIDDPDTCHPQGE